jgi:hypothetical protein
MTVRPQDHEVKQFVQQSFLDLGVASRDLFCLRETTLAQGDRRLVRTYHAGDLKAVWSIDAGTVKVYDAEGCLLRVVNLLSRKVAQLVAA